jgi:hypothetical protein
VADSMNSDESTRAGSLGYRPPGQGMQMRYTCDKCRRTQPTEGRKRVRGIWWWCKDCQK